MLCKWCGMESDTEARCNWCNGVLTPEAEQAETVPSDAVESSETSPAAAIKETPAGKKPGRHAPAPPIPAGSRRHTPAPPMPPRSLRSETAENAGAAPTPSLSEPTIAFARPPQTDSLSPALLEPTVQMNAFAPQAEEEVGGLAAGMAKAVEKPKIPTNAIEAMNSGAGSGQLMSKYYAGKTVEETTGIGSGPIDVPVAPREPAKPRKPKKEPDLDIQWIDRQEFSPAILWTRFAGAFAVVLVVAGLIAHFTSNLILPLVLANFAGGILVPVLHVGPWQDEDAEDSGWLVLFTVIFGPFAALIVYGVMSAVKQMTNSAVIGIMVVAAATRLTVDLAAGTLSIGSLTPLQPGHFEFMKLLLQWGGLIGLVGWIIANVFHKLDE